MTTRLACPARAPFFLTSRLKATTALTHIEFGDFPKRPLRPLFWRIVWMYIFVALYRQYTGSLYRHRTCPIANCNEYKSSVLFFGVGFFLINAKVLLASLLLVGPNIPIIIIMPYPLTKKADKSPAQNPLSMKADD